MPDPSAGGDTGLPSDPPDEPGDSSCTDELAPGGQQCSCFYTDCDGCEIACTCHADCHEGTLTCLINVQNGQVLTQDPVLQAFELGCVLVEVEQEDDVSEHLRCTGTRDCSDPSLGDDDDDDTDDDDDDDSGDDDDSDDDDDDDDEEPLCVVPVPDANSLAGPVWGEYDVQFYVPHSSWAFGTAHAWRWLEGLGDGLGLRLSPSFFFATALKESYMGCSAELPEPDLFQPGRLERREASYADGCFQIESTTAWTELCRMYPDVIACDRVGHRDVISSIDQATTGRDNVATSALLKAYYDTFAYSMIPHVHKHSDPDAWFADAADPLAMEKVVAVLYNRGVWSGNVTAILDLCQHDVIENCLEWASDYPIQISQYTRELEAEVAQGNCYDDPMSLADVDRYLDEILLLFRDVDETAVRAGVHDTFAALANGAPTVGFQRLALPVLDRIDEGLPGPVACPAAGMQEYYQASCP